MEDAFVAEKRLRHQYVVPQPICLALSQKFFFTEQQIFPRNTALLKP